MGDTRHFWQSCKFTDSLGGGGFLFSDNPLCKIGYAIGDSNEPYGMSSVADCMDVGSENPEKYNAVMVDNPCNNVLPDNFTLYDNCLCTLITNMTDVYTWDGTKYQSCLF